MTRALIEVTLWGLAAMIIIVVAGIAGDLAYDAGRAAMHLEDAR
jgi:hypothetical protein